MNKRTRSFIVDEHTAMMNTYLFNGIWKITNRTQLNDGRWHIDCVEA